MVIDCQRYDSSYTQIRVMNFDQNSNFCSSKIQHSRYQVQGIRLKSWYMATTGKKDKTLIFQNLIGLSLRVCALFFDIYIFGCVIRSSVCWQYETRFVFIKSVVLRNSVFTVSNMFSTTGIDWSVGHYWINQNNIKDTQSKINSNHHSFPMNK